MMKSTANSAAGPAVFSIFMKNSGATAYAQPTETWTKPEHRRGLHLSQYGASHSRHRQPAVHRLRALHTLRVHR